MRLSFVFGVAILKIEYPTLVHEPKAHTFVRLIYICVLFETVRVTIFFVDSIGAHALDRR